MSTFLFSRKTFSSRETVSLGEKCAKKLKPGDILCLEGNLGAGKTTFVRGVASGLGWTGHVKSPGFILMIPYETHPPLVHADLYRLKPCDVTDIGLEDYCDGGNIVVIEWADRMNLQSYDDYLRIVFERKKDFREIAFYTKGGRFRHFKIENAI